MFAARRLVLEYTQSDREIDTKRANKESPARNASSHAIQQQQQQQQPSKQLKSAMKWEWMIICKRKKSSNGRKWLFHYCKGTVFSISCEREKKRLSKRAINICAKSLIGYCWCCLIRLPCGLNFHRWCDFLLLCFANRYKWVLKISIDSVIQMIEQLQSFFMRCHLRIDNVALWIGRFQQKHSFNAIDYANKKRKLCPFCTIQCGKSTIAPIPLVSISNG